MNKISIDLEHCYGIKQFKHQFEFGSANACAVYAPNGAMKSSLARTFQDLAEGKASGDRVFPKRINKRSITGTAGNDLEAACVLVVQPYDEVLGHSERTSNSRFFVPFKLFAKNREAVMLGQEAILSLGFRFEDGTETTTVDKSNLIAVLSTGEKKALYILNVIFEIEARRAAGQKTLLVVDDIADSFDYKNKYAIIQYLMEIADGPLFKQLLLTHNFDFFRTVSSRFVPYNNCHMANKSGGTIHLNKAAGIKNIFVNDWKKAFYSDPTKRIATIPFMRNLVEFTQGESDPAYIKLTSLLHWKADTASLTETDLDSIYVGLFGGTEKWVRSAGSVVDAIFGQADACLTAQSGINFENKVVLSLAARLWVERFMISKINDPQVVTSIVTNQTPSLLKKYIKLGSADPAAIKVIQRVVLMTPENIHLNSFMYEPILDMSDDHLKALYTDAKKLT
jgi:energy-coupling factor transporter ATP-binding protein EcfA2